MNSEEARSEAFAYMRAFIRRNTAIFPQICPSGTTLRNCMAGYLPGADFARSDTNPPGMIELIMKDAGGMRTFLTARCFELLDYASGGVNPALSTETAVFLVKIPGMRVD